MGYSLAARFKGSRLIKNRFAGSLRKRKGDTAQNVEAKRMYLYIYTHINVCAYAYICVCIYTCMTMNYS